MSAQPTKLQDVAHAVTGAGANTVTITAPAVTSLVIAVCYATGLTPPTWAAPAGFSHLGVRATGTLASIDVFWRVGDGSTTSYTFTPTTAVESVVELMEWGGTSLSVGNSTADGTSQTAGTTWTAPSLNKAVSGGVVLTAGGDDFGGTTTLSAGTGQTLGHSTNGSTLGTLGVEWETLPDTSNPAFQATFSSTNSHVHVCLAVEILPMTVLGVYSPDAGATGVAKTITPTAGTGSTANLVKITEVVTTGGVLTNVVSGGTSPYTADTTDHTVATASLVGTTLTITGVGVGSCNVLVKDSLGNIVLFGALDVTGLSCSPASFVFISYTSAAQTGTISGGTSPYMVATSDATIATVGIVGSTVTITPVGAGTCLITVTDSGTPALTLEIPVSVSGTSPTTLQIWPI